MPTSGTVAVIGGGIAGLTAALNLARRQFSVTLVEREPVLGGNSHTVCCKAIAGRCQSCGGCLLSGRVADATQHPGIEILTRTTISQAQRRTAGYQLTLSSPSAGTSDIMADAIVLATGFDHVDARSKGPYGYGVVPSVTTGEEMERRLRSQGQSAYDTKALTRVAFVQCVGSRDEHAGRGYCSQVCCRYALRLARLLKSRYPDMETTIYKMDIQRIGRDMNETWSKAQREGVRIVSGLPAVIRRSTHQPGGAAFLFSDALCESYDQEEYDLVVLCTGIRPRDDADAVADLFGLNQDRHGFFAASADYVTSSVAGVFLAGCCQAPRSMAESVAHATGAAQRCARFLSGCAQ